MLHSTKWTNFSSKQEVILTRKAYYGCLSHFDELKAWTFFWKPNASSKNIFGCDCGEGVDVAITAGH